MENDNEKKAVFKRVNLKVSAIFTLAISIIFIIGAYLNITELFQDVEGSTLSLLLIITAALKSIFGVVMLGFTIWLLFKNDKNT
jgi:hypothetical protein